MAQRFRGLLLLCTFGADALLGAPREPGSESEFSVRLETFAIAWRENAPLPLTVTVSRRGPGVVSGRLELSFTDGHVLVGTLRTHELAFSSVEQSYRILVPPLRGSESWAQLSAKIRFIGEERKVPLEEQLLLVAPNQMKKHLVGVCASKATTEETARVVRSLRLEPFSEFRGLGGLSTMPWPVPAREISTDPLHYCLYDVLLFDGSQFGELSEAQHRALRVWVKAGGRLFVLAGPSLGRRGQSFLERLERESSPASWPRLDPADPTGAEPTTSSQWGRELRLLRCGLGRVVVAGLAPADEEHGSAEWKQVLAFLWNLSLDDEESLLRRGPRALQYVDATYYFSNQTAERTMIDELLPGEIQVIPPAVIGVMLGVFAFIVGPLEYLVLGFFRMRRLTWVVFPATCVAFSVATLRLSEAHLGAQDFDRSMAFVDVGRGGEVLRTSRYRLLFSAEEGRTTSHAEDELLTLCQNEDEDPWRYGRPRRGGRPADGRFGAEDLPAHEGLVPEKYGMSYRVRQWAPHLERRFRLGPEGAVPDLDWDALESLNGSEVTQLDRVRELLVGDRAFEGSIYVLQGKAKYTVDRTEYDSRFPVMLFFHRPLRYRDSEALHPFVGPSGGSGFYDLPCLDTGNPNEFLIVVVQEAGGDLTIYRRLYHGAGS